MIIELLGVNDNEIIDGEFVVPDSVTSIGKYVFFKCTGLTSVTIPDSVTSIGDWAFYGCTGLTSVTIPDSVTSIGEYAFYGCTGLTSVTIPNSVTRIGVAAFRGCTKLKNISVDINNQYYSSVTSIGGCAFSGCTGLKSVTIPDGVMNIGNGAFSGCRSLTSVTIPDSITRIGNYAFYGCTGLKSEIGNYKAFGADMSCRGYKYEIGKWSEEVRDPILCLRGYHYCTNLFDVFNYYYGKYDKDFIICECEVGDVIIEQSGNNKHVTNQIKPIRKLKWKEVLELMNGNKTEK